MDDNWREKIALTLELAAKKLRAGDDTMLAWTSRNPDYFEEFDFQSEAREDAEEWCVCDDDEWHPDIEMVSWGVYVAVELAEQCDREDTPEGPYDYTCSYKLFPTVKENPHIRYTESAERFMDDEIERSDT